MATESPETPTSPMSETPGTNSPAKAADPKIEVFLKAVGDAPIMKNRKYSVAGSRTIAWVLEFIRKYLKLGKEDSLFLYVNQCFAPAPDQSLSNLFNCFGSNNKLILHYSTTQAWG